MDRSNSMLFAPPQPPIRLVAGDEVMIGRRPDCGITVGSTRASRRHAVVRSDDDRVSVEDLGSTNGTFVNGQRIEGTRALEPGDRIVVGDVQVTYCVVDSAPPPTPLSADQTVIALDGPTETAGEALEGDLAEIPMFAVLQMLEMGGQTGRLDLDGDRGFGKAWLRQGRLIHAESEKDTGMPAALTLAQSECGRFAFTPSKEPHAEASFDSGVTEIILEASRLLDESR